MVQTTPAGGDVRVCLYMAEGGVLAGERTLFIGHGYGVRSIARSLTARMTWCATRGHGTTVSDPCICVCACVHLCVDACVWVECTCTRNTAALATRGGQRWSLATTH
jgi:hypothetical protein